MMTTYRSPDTLSNAQIHLIVSFLPYKAAEEKFNVCGVRLLVVTRIGLNKLRIESSLFVTKSLQCEYFAAETYTCPANGTISEIY